MKYTENTLTEAINRLAKTEDGKIVLSYIKELCGWDRTVLASDDALATMFYASKRGVYGGIRKQIKPENLKGFEFDYQLKLEEKSK